MLDLKKSLIPSLVKNISITYIDSITIDLMTEMDCASAIGSLF